MSLLLDSHTLLWFLERSPKLSVAAVDALSGSTDVWLLSAISVAEAHGVIRKGKSAVTVAELFAFLGESGEVEVVPVDLAIVRQAVEFDHLDGIHDKITASTIRSLSRRLDDLRLVSPRSASSRQT